MKAPNISPYCLKLETFLRVHKINYIVEEDNALNGPTKQAPWITFNGVNHGDSQGCIELLAEKFNVDPNPGMSDEDKAVYESFRAVLEDRLIPMMALERFYWLKCDDFKEVTPPIFPSMIPSFMHNFIWNHMGKGTKKTSPFGKLTRKGASSPLNEVGLAAVASLHDNAEMEKFVSRVAAEMMDLEVTEQQQLSGMVPFYSGVK